MFSQAVRVFLRVRLGQHFFQTPLVRFALEMLLSGPPVHEEHVAADAIKLALSRLVLVLWQRGAAGLELGPILGLEVLVDQVVLFLHPTVAFRVDVRGLVRLILLFLPGAALGHTHDWRGVGYGDGSSVFFVYVDRQYTSKMDSWLGWVCDGKDERFYDESESTNVPISGPRMFKIRSISGFVIAISGIRSTSISGFRHRQEPSRIDKREGKFSFLQHHSEHIQYFSHAMHLLRLPFHCDLSLDDKKKHTKTPIVSTFA